MREAYRLHKHCLATTPGAHFLIGYIYLGSSRLCDFSTIQEKVITSLQYLNHLQLSLHDDSLQA